MLKKVGRWFFGILSFVTFSAVGVAWCNSTAMATPVTGYTLVGGNSCEDAVVQVTPGTIADRDASFALRDVNSDGTLSDPIGLSMVRHVGQGIQLVGPVIKPGETRLLVLTATALDDGAQPIELTDRTVISRPTVVECQQLGQEMPEQFIPSQEPRITSN